MRLWGPARKGVFMTRIALMIVAILLALVLLAACGDSDEENAPEAAPEETAQGNTQETARQTVCDARDDISEQVDTLKGITPETGSTRLPYSTSLAAIQSDLLDIERAEADLSDDLRQQVQSANQAFETQVEGTVKEIGESTTVTEAESTIAAAADELASSYEETFAGIDCG